MKRKRDRRPAPVAAGPITPHVAGPPAGVSWKVLAGWFALGLAVRLPFLGRADLWCDEILFCARDSMPPLTPWAILGKFYSNFLVVTHMPLSQMIQNVFLWIFSLFEKDLATHAFLQRLPSALLGSASVPLLNQLARRLAGERVGRLAGLMWALFFYPVYFSREAYVYAALMVFSISSMQAGLDLLKWGYTRRRLRLFFFTLLGTAYTFPAGWYPVAAFFGLAVLFLFANRFIRPGGRPAALRVAGASLVVGLLVLPFALQLVTKPSGHHFSSHLSVGLVLSDLMGKLFMGVKGWSIAAGWLLLLAGLGALLRGGDQAAERRLFAAIFVFCFAATLFMVTRTQYVSRYFMAVAPFMFLLLAQGVDAAAGGLARALRVPALAPRLAYAVVLGLAAVHLVYFHREGYRLTARARDYGAMARWLTQNLPAGTPYVMESGYDLRFVSGFYPTPNLIPACPYIHGPGREEMDRLRARQQDFMMRFPEAPYVEASRHGSEPNSDVGVWTWPHQQFRRQHEIYNEPLRRLVERGIYPQVSGASVPETEYRTLIWYNTAEDVRDMAVAQGRNVLFNYPGWSVAQVQQGVYFRAHSGGRGLIEVNNLGAAPARGVLRLQGALGAPQESIPFEMRLNNGPAWSFERFGSQVWSIDLPEVELPPGRSSLQWTVQGAGSLKVQGLLVDQLQFVPAG